jgi:hypothetical protein
VEDQQNDARDNFDSFFVLFGTWQVIGDQLCFVVRANRNTSCQNLAIQTQKVEFDSRNHPGRASFYGKLKKILLSSNLLLFVKNLHLLTSF